MARHRNVRGYNYDDDFEDDDLYGHSVDDDYCISPATAAQFMYKRDRHASFTEPLEEEDEFEVEEQDRAKAPHIALSSVDQARLFSCLEHMREVLGESVAEQVMIDAVLKYQFDVAKALDFVFKTDSEMNAKPGSNNVSSTGKPAKEAIFSSLQNLNTAVKKQPVSSSDLSNDKHEYSSLPAPLSLSSLLSESPHSGSSGATPPSLSELSLSELISQPPASDASDLLGSRPCDFSHLMHLSEDAGLKNLQLDPLKSRPVKQPTLNNVRCEAPSSLDKLQAFSFPKPSHLENHVLSEQGNLFGSLSSVLYSEDSMSSDGENLSVPKYGSPSLADLIQEHKKSNDFHDLTLVSPQKTPCKTEEQATSLLPLSQFSEFSNTLFELPSLTLSLSSLAVSQPSTLAEPQISLADLMGEADKPVFDSLNLFQPNLSETDTDIDLRFLINKPAHSHSPKTKSSEALKNRKKCSHLVKTLKAKPSAFALSLCFKYIPKACRKEVFLSHQDHKLSPSDIVDVSYPALIPFHFQTPSPDDIVKESQKKAFVR